MTTLLRSFWQGLFGQKPEPAAEVPAPAETPPRAVSVLPLDFAPNDPLTLYFQTSPGAVEVDGLKIESPAVRALRAANVKIAVPLVSQGDLIGLLCLGPRRSEQDYGADDRGLLSNLASQAAPAVRVAQLVRQQQIEAQARERIEQELRVARLIQQTLLPKELPNPHGWQVAAHYQPAQAVGGDFYDFIHFADGRLGLIIGDVTDKGVPAALVMATTRSILRGASEQSTSPGQILERVNNRLCPDIPPKMFVTCLYAILDTATGRLTYANAGHDLPYCRTATGVVEMRATGMPLGLLPGMRYEEREIVVQSGDSVLLYSDGIVEAHSPSREMFGFPRLAALIAQHPGGEGLIGHLLEQLASFTGVNWEQEDDTTMVLIQRQPSPLTPLPQGEGEALASTPHLLSHGERVASLTQGDEGQREDRALKADGWRVVTQFKLASEPGNERDAMKRVAEAVADLNLPGPRLEKLKTAVSEATMNAIEHGNQNRAELPVDIRVLRDSHAVAVQITDHGGGQAVPEPATPDLDAKLAGLQSPRGWGLFLIAKMVDEMNTASDAVHHTVELILNLGGENDNPTV